MATQQQQIDFISKASLCAQAGYRKYGKVLPSVAIGMACVECAYGTAGSVKFHSYLGHKVGSGKTATAEWGGKFFTAKTKEEYTVGTHTVIQAAFRAYDSMQQCFLNFYELLNTKLYERVKAGADYKTQMQQIKLCGYMTSSTEVNSVISIIEKWNLTKYDVTSGTVVTVPQLGLYTCTAFGLNIRADATHTSESIGEIRKGSRVLIDRIENGWGHIKDGWVRMSYMDARIH